MKSIYFCVIFVLFSMAGGASEMTASLLQQQKQYIQNPDQVDFSTYEDWTRVEQEVSHAALSLGDEAIAKGKVACLLLGGGQGSRLGSGRAKGLEPVSLIQRKSLLQMFLEKIACAQRKYRVELPLLVMTSSGNHQEIVEFLTQNQWFGLQERQIFFFTQDNLPFCDEKGQWLYTNEGHVLSGPDGNGRALHRLYESGGCDFLRAKGVEHITMIQIDNPLADPFDRMLIALHCHQHSDVSAIAVTRDYEGEKAGMFASEGGALRVIEYIEQFSKNFSFINTGLYCFTLDFVEHVGSNNLPLPWHLAHKQFFPGQCGWKFEYFIFDVFRYAERFSVLVKPRLECFSPLKNATGEKSIATVQKDLSLRDRKRYHELSRQEAQGAVELSWDFYYATPEEEKKWRSAVWPSSGYITPKQLFSHSPAL